MNHKSHKRTATLAFLFTLSIMVSCSSFKNKKDYINIGKKYSINFINENDCNSYEYSHKKSGIKLNGRYKLKTYRGLIADFVDGKLHGNVKKNWTDKRIEYSQYSNGLKNGKSIEMKSIYSRELKRRAKWKTISHYKNNYLHGIRQTYRNSKLSSECTYDMGMKNGIEYNFNTEGDTTSIISYKRFFDYSFHGMKDTLTECDFVKDIQFYEYGGQIEIEEILSEDEDLFSLLFFMAEFPFECRDTPTYYIVEYNGIDRIVFFNMDIMMCYEYYN